MVLVIDNFDSFTYNLVQLVRASGQEVLVRRNDEITIDEAKQLDPGHVILSPGPGGPEQAGVCLAIADAVLAGHLKTRLLGVCLGHQVIAHQAGAKVRLADNVRHGKVSQVAHDGQGIFLGIASPMNAVRYHSLAADEAPTGFTVTARSLDDDEIMGIRHESGAIEGVQFHPESILTTHGQEMIDNFVKRGS